MLIPSVFNFCFEYFDLFSFFRKPKRVVEVRASKGRMLRYLRLPKAVDFMSPDLTEWFSEEQRKNLFAQLKANKD